MVRNSTSANRIGGLNAQQPICTSQRNLDLHQVRCKRHFDPPTLQNFNECQEKLFVIQYVHIGLKIY